MFSYFHDNFVFNRSEPHQVSFGNHGTSVQETVVEEDTLSWKFWRKRRYMVVFLAFLGFFNVYSLRVNLSVAIVAMTENHSVYNESSNSTNWVQEFNWDSKEKGLILSSFFYGYIFTQLLGGFIGAKIGGNIVSIRCLYEYIYIYM